MIQGSRIVCDRHGCNNSATVHIDSCDKDFCEKCEQEFLEHGGIPFEVEQTVVADGPQSAMMQTHLYPGCRYGVQGLRAEPLGGGKGTWKVITTLVRVS